MKVQKKRVKSEITGSVVVTKGLRPIDEDRYPVWKTHQHMRLWVLKRIIVYCVYTDELGYLIIWEDAEGVQMNEVDSFRSVELFIERFENNVKFKVLAG